VFGLSVEEPAHREQATFVAGLPAARREGIAAGRLSRWDIR
jgi:hypothetical protein